jgi:hypothetical protein
MQPAILLQHINEHLGATFKLLTRYQDGEQGAFAIADQHGKRFVLKWSHSTEHLTRLEEAAAVTTHLQSLGYPAPLYLSTGIIQGGCYSIQETLPGAPMQTVTQTTIASLLQLNTLQRGQAVITRQEWPERVIETVLQGGDGYCVIESLRTYSTTTAQLLDTLQAIVTTHANDHYETHDIVHYDFHPANILVTDGQISGVIDWDGTCSGDASFDLATLLCFSYAHYAPYDTTLHKKLQQHILERLGPGPLRVYLAHMLVRQVDWVIRYYNHQEVERWLNAARRILNDMPPR